MADSGDRLCRRREEPFLLDSKGASIVKKQGSRSVRPTIGALLLSGDKKILPGNMSFIVTEIQTVLEADQIKVMVSLTQ